MEKVIVILQSAAVDEQWCEHLRGPVAAELLDLGLAGLAVNVRDRAVADAMLAITTLEPPAVAVLSLWTQQCYGEQLTAALNLLGGHADAIAAFSVTESTPLPPPDPGVGARTPGLANVALLRRPADLDTETWLHRWQIDHTRVAIDTQATFGYTQNVVVRALTENAPVIDGIVEELFPDGATTSPHIFYGARDDADLNDRITAMMASVNRFGADRNLDVVPTSRYVYRTPFQA